MCVNSEIIFIWRARELYRKKPYLLLSPFAWTNIIFDVVFVVLANGEFKGYSLRFLSSKDATKAQKLKNALLDPSKNTLSYRGSLEIFTAILWYPFFAELVLSVKVLSFELALVVIFILFPSIVLWGERSLWRKAKRTGLARVAVLSVRPCYSKDFILKENHIVFIDLVGKEVEIEEVKETRDLNLFGKIGLFLMGYPWGLKQKIILKDGTSVFLGKKFKKANKNEGAIYLIKAGVLWLLIIAGLYLYLEKGSIMLALISILLYLWMEEK